MKRIMVIEDEVFMREELMLILQKASYKTTCLTNFEHPVEQIMQAAPDLVLLDLNLPGLSGFQICQMLREKSTVPILVLTSRDQMKDELTALELGADEYLTKPCHKERLLARISSLLRRSEDRSHLLEYGSFKMDTRTYTLEYEGRYSSLPENQGKIIGLLLKNQGRLVTKQQLFMEIWGTTEFVDENALQVNMTRLKRSLAALDADGRIETVRGKGYCIH